MTEDIGLGRRGFLRGAAVAGASVTSLAGTAVASDPYSTEPVRIDSWDDTTLAGTLWRPDGDGPFPSVLMTHGWGGDHGSARIRRIADIYARNGYVVLAYDSRGFGESGGEVGVDGPKEVADARHLVSWLADHADVENDGPDDPKVGMDNVSYAAGIQLNTAAEDDRLDAIVPRWGWHHLAYSLAPNGVIKAGWDTLLYAIGVTGSRGVTSGDGRPGREDAQHGLPPSLHEAYAASTATNELPDDYEAYLTVRSPVQDVGDIETPTLLVGGWNDTLFTPTETLWNYHGLDAEKRLLFIQGGHTLESTPSGSEQAFIDRQALAWLDEHVAGRGDATLAPVTYYEVQTGEWKSIREVPEAGDRTLDFADAATGDSSVVVNSLAPTSNSQLLVRRNGDHAPATHADFDFPLDEGTTVFGVPELTLTVEPIGPETRLFVKVFHVSDGEATLVNNQVTPIRVEDTGTHHLELAGFERTFDAGDRLRVSIATTDAAFYGSRTSLGARVRHAPGETTLALPVLGEEPSSPGNANGLGRQN